MTRNIVMFGLSAIAAALPAAGGTTAIVSADGAATIVIPASATPVQKYAAEELRDWTEKMTGVRLSIADDSGTLPKRAVVIGRTRFTEKLLADPKFDAKTLGEDGYRLVARGKRLLVVGDGAHAAIYGVYGLLEDHGGCRWFTFDCCDIPKRKTFEVPDGLDDVQVPAFPIRDMGDRETYHNPEFAVRLRIQGPRMKKLSEDPRFGGIPLQFDGRLHSCHSFDSLLPPKKWFKEHPEYFSERNGFREPYQPCLSNPDVRRIVKQELLDHLAVQYPKGGRYFDVSQNDNSFYCTCAKCKALDDREGTPAASIVDFVNEMADAVAEKYPDVILHTLAYMYSVKAPKTMKLRPSVQVVLCSDQCDHSKPFEGSRNGNSRLFAREPVEWGKKASQIQIWDYSINFRSFPQAFPNFYQLQDSFKFFRRNGVTHVYEEHEPATRSNLYKLRNWVMAHLMWNPDRPLDPLVDEFLRGYYGAGAAGMRKYFDLIHAEGRKLDERLRPLHMWGHVTNSGFPDSMFEESAKFLKEAQAAVAGDPVLTRRVRIERAMNDFTRILRDNVGAPVEVSRHPEYVNGERFKDLREAAQSYYALMNEDGHFSYVGEQRSMNERWMRKVRHLAKMDPAAVKAADRATLGVEMVGIDGKADKAEVVDDPDASGGKAVKIYPKAGGGVAQYYLHDVHFDKGGKYRLRVRAKVQPKPGAKGGAFRCGVWSNAASFSPNELYGTTVNADKASAGYAWYDVGKPWRPDVGEKVHFGNAPWDPMKSNFNPNVEAVWLDCLEIIRVD